MENSSIIVSFIIINYKTPDLTNNCIESIIQNVRNIPYEIVVVDNNSEDNSITKIREKYNTIVLIESHENLGFGRANNLGAEYAQGKFLFLLNSDTIVKNNPLEWFIKFYESNSNVGAIGSYLHDGEGKYTLSGGKTYSIKKYLKIALRGILRITSTKYEVPCEEKPQKVDYVIGADLFIRKQLFHSIGGFDPNIFMYFEDVELCKRLTDEGFQNYIIPGPDIIHFVKSSSTSQFARVYNTASLMYCIRKNTGSFKFRLFQFIYLLLKLPILLRLSSFKKEWEYISSIYKYKKYLVN
ncbi:MAG: glycosyltransferase family 2 protein [Muribaculaceae bacterium]|nr:glycosyltransferase family 2 protein [Muribaculaceae bacterium]